MTPKVFIGTPVHVRKDYCMFRFMNAVSDLVYPDFHHCVVDNSPNVDYATNLKKVYDQSNRSFFHVETEGESLEGGASHKRLVASYNLMRDQFLATDCEFFMTLECDVMIPSDGLKLLVEADKDIVQGQYYIGFFSEPETNGNGLIQFYHNKGLNGVSLFKREVLEQIKFKYSEDILAAHQDAFFFAEAVAAGFESWFHRDVKCDHMAGWQ